MRPNRTEFETEFEHEKTEMTWNYYRRARQTLSNDDSNTLNGNTPLWCSRREAKEQGSQNGLVRGDPADSRGGHGRGAGGAVHVHGPASCITRQDLEMFDAFLPKKERREQQSHEGRGTLLLRDATWLRYSASRTSAF